MKPLNWWVVAAALIAALPLSVGFGSAQTPVRSKAAGGLTCEDVIKLSKAGLAEDIIVQQIKKNGHGFDLSTDQLLALKAANVSDRVVEVMLDPGRPGVTEPSAVSPSPLVAKAETLPHELTAEAASREELPTETGVYVKKHGEWVELSPEIVYWKTGGVMKTIATAGVRREDVNGHVPGASSHTHLEGPLQFLIIAPDGTALAEYQLVRLRQNKDNREFRTVTGGFLHAQSGAQRDIIQFDGRKLGNRVFAVTFPSESGSGEYGFLPPGSTNGSGKIYSFRNE